MKLLNKFFSEEENNEKHDDITVPTENNNESIKKTMPEKKIEKSEMNTHDQRVEIESRMSELANQYSKLRGSLKLSLFSERDEFTEDKEKTEQEISDLSNRQEIYTAQKDELSAEDDAELYEQLENNKQQLENQNELIEKYQEQNNGVENDLKINTDALNQIDSSIESNQQAENNLSEEIKNETDLKKMYELMENQKKAVANLYEEREGLTVQRDGLVDTKNKLSAENQQLLASIEETSETASHIKTQISQLDRQIQDNAQRRTQSITQLTSQINAVNSELTSKTNHLNTINKNIKDLDTKIQNTFNSDHLVRDVKFDNNKTYAVLQPSNDTDGNLTTDIHKYIMNKTGHDMLTLTTQSFDNISQLSGNNIDLYKDIQFSNNPTTKRVSIQDKEEWKTVKEDGVTKIFDDNDNLLMSVNFDNQLISSIDYYTDDKFNKSNIYDKDGILSKTKFYNDKSSIIEETYYRTDGSTALTKQFESEQLTSIQLFDEDGLQTNVFSSEAQMIRWWFEKSTKEYSNLVLVGDPTDEIFKDLSSDDELNIETLVYLNNVHSNIGRMRALLHSKPVIYDILVTNQDDLQSIEDITDRDLNVSVIKDTVYASNSEKLPNALI